MRIRKTIVSPSKSVLNIAEWHRGLRIIQKKLLKRYRIKQPKPENMPAYKLNEEWDMLRRLSGTTFMTKPLFDRWLKVDITHSSRVACEAACQY